MQRFDVLSRDLNVFGTHFLEASAGTGKTFAIEHLVARLMLEGEKPLAIEQILVVTFTRAATRELKLRIRSNLEKVFEQLKQGESTLDYLQAICDAGIEAIQKAIQRIEEALVCFDQAQIFTVHGFCHRLLSEFAFEAHLNFEMSDPDEKDHVGVLDLIVKDFLRTGLALPEYSPGQIQMVLKKFKSDFPRMKKEMISKLSQEKVFASFPSFSHYFSQITAALEPFKGTLQDKLVADYTLLSPRYKMVQKDKGFVEQVSLLGALLEKKDLSMEEIDSLVSAKTLFLEKFAPDNLKARVKPLDRQLLHYPGLFDRLHQELLPLLKAAGHPRQTFLRMLSDCQRLSQKTLDKIEKFSHDALLKRMQLCLQSSSFVEKARQKYRAAIIDEFQDTDPIQWEIFQKLFLKGMDSICLVGDPKQSIYSFRSADIYTYIEASKAAGVENLKFLDTNFRSTPALVDALNQLFSTSEGKHWMKLPAWEQSLDIPAVKAGKQGSAGSLHFFLTEALPSSHSQKWPSLQTEEEILFPFIVQQMRQAKKPWDSFAILVKDRYQAQRVFECFKKHQIPASLKRGGILKETLAFFAMKELLDAICFPSDLSKMKKWLVGLWLGWEAEAVEGSLENVALQKAKERLLFFHEIFSKKGFAFFFQEFLNSKWESETILETILRRHGRSFYTDLRQLVELLMEESSSQEGLLKCLEEMRSEDSEEEVRSQEEKNSAIIMTMHASKGLEFDTVFALGLASRHKPHEEISLKKEGKEVLSLLDSSSSECQKALQEIDAEKMRQLYVALTRAKTALFVPVIFDKSLTPLKFGEASPIELFLAYRTKPLLTDAELYAEPAMIEPATVTLYLDKLAETGAITYSWTEPQAFTVQDSAEEELMELFPPPTLTPSWQPQRYLSFSAMATHSQPLLDLPSAQPQDLPLGAETGLVFHRIMEKIFKQSLHCPLQKESIYLLTEKESFGTPLEKFKEALYSLVIDNLQLCLSTPLDAFTLSDIAPSQLQQEMEFAYFVPGGLMRGFADLVFERQGRYYLLDWKTNFLGEDYGPERLQEAMEQNDYFLQASIYTEALKRYVKLFDIRPFEESFGGVFYLFVRGKTVLYRGLHELVT